MGLLDIFIPLSSAIKTAQEAHAAREREARVQSWNEYARDLNLWADSVSSQLSDYEATDAIRYLWNYTGQLFDFQRAGMEPPAIEYREKDLGWYATPPIIIEVFEKLPGYDPGGGYPAKYNLCRGKKDKDTVDILNYSTAKRIYLMQKENRLSFVDVYSGISSKSFAHLMDVKSMQVYHEFLQWYDRELGKHGIQYPLMFLASRYDNLSIPEKEDLCVQVQSMDKYDIGMYFWYPNRHVAGLIKNPSKR